MRCPVYRKEVEMFLARRAERLHGQMGICPLASADSDVIVRGFCGDR